MPAAASHGAPLPRRPRRRHRLVAAAIAAQVGADPSPSFLVAEELEACRGGCLPGREAAEGSTIWWTLHRLLFRTHGNCAAEHFEDTIARRALGLPPAVARDCHGSRAAMTCSVS